MTIDEFARQVNSSARNVRAYLERGLLPPPRMVARTGLYDQRHVQRMAVIHRLQQSGFSLEGIRVLCEAQAAGNTLEDLLGPPTLQAPVAVDAATPFPDSKFRRPALDPTHVRRARCLALLNRGAPTHALITAPTGSGKSVLAAQLVASPDRPTAWVSLDEDDNDPARFWTAILIAVRGTLSNFGDELLTAIINGGDIDRAVGAVADQLARRSAGLLLVLDDLHAVSDPAVVRQLDWFVEHVPAADCRVVICSRTRPALAVARLVMSGELTHLHTHDLRFDAIETSDLLITRLGLDVDQAAVHEIAASVDGWASGISRAGLALRDGNPPNTVLDSLAAADDRIQSYFSELELARGASEDPLARVLESVAETILRTAAYRTVVLNLFRPEWDDYDVVLVVGGQESRDILLGTTKPRELFDRVLAVSDERVPGLHFLPAPSSVWKDMDAVYTPNLARSDDPDAWQPEDALFVALRDDDDEPLAIVSMDEPRSGRRPTDADLRLLHAICAYAEQALRTARRGQQAQDDRHLLARLSEISPKLSTCNSRPQLHDLVVETISPYLGFERAAIYHGRSDALQLTASRGWDPDGPPSTVITRATAERELDPRREQAGCWLVNSEAFFDTQALGARRSRRNGRGPRAWSDHCLVVPWRTNQTRLAGVLVVEDPVDRLIPNHERRRTIRLLVDLAASVENTIDPSSITASTTMNSTTESARVSN
jgi:DNA-binding transcriptional MerR regulator/GAF domain-containing protein